jgi:phosphate:Na+ symporter
LNHVINILTLIGSLGLFLFGMKVMSEALQKVAGTGMRKILATVTFNRLRSITTGFLITASIQSSSATTVMIVSLVNAGLLSLFAAIGLIMGANIGTTITAWLISLLGFNLNIGTFALPLIGIGLPLIFSSHYIRKSWGEFLIGFALIFIGLNFLKTTFPDISAQPELLKFVTNFSDKGFLGHLIFLFVGLAITVLIQSSSAAMVLTFVMSYKGWIGFEMAAVMVLGENIGTTITANLAALVANTSGKRSALSHFLFNLIGSIWGLLLLRFFLMMIDLIIVHAGKPSPYTDSASIPVALSIFHTVFNLINTFILVGFIPQLEKITAWLLPVKKETKEPFRLKYLRTGLLSISELSILQARKEVAIYAGRAYKIFRMVRELFNETSQESYKQSLEKIHNHKMIIEQMENEIASYLTKLSEGELSKPVSLRIRAMLKMIGEIESIGDSCFKIARAIQRKKDDKIWFSQDLRNNLNKMFDLLDAAFEIMLENLEADVKYLKMNQAMETEEKINDLRNKLKQEYFENSEIRDYKYQAGVIYNDIVTFSERFGDFIFNVSFILAESMQQE